jgi:phenylalanyl-tRNA synthetase alpha chain
LHKYEIAVLKALKGRSGLGLEDLMKAADLGKDEAMWALQNLIAGGLVDAKSAAREEATLTEEGIGYAEKGLPERRLLGLLEKGDVDAKSLSDRADQIGLMWAKKKGLVEIDKGAVRLTGEGKRAAEGETEDERILKDLRSDAGAYAKYRNTSAVAEFRKRGLLETRSRKEVREVHITAKGARALGEAREEADLIENVDRSMIKGRLWEGKKFRPYNVGAPVEPRDVAMRHPLRRTIDDLRNAYLRSGFTEVTGPIIQPSFWVFDYLFMPQDHPARDEQDTFFVSEPKELEVGDRKVVMRVKDEHERAWHANWSEEFAMQAVPRTHTTSVTGRYVHQMLGGIERGLKDYELPIKLFTIGRNLRNEDIDYKHLADFYQSDGIIIGKDLTLANLFDVLVKLFKGVGIDKVRFRPSYYPFVEPGVSVQTEKNGEWLELAGAGILRREVTGISRKKISVLAWGTGVERLLLIRDKKISSIASLYNASAGWLREMTVR